MDGGGVHNRMMRARSRGEVLSVSPGRLVAVANWCDITQQPAIWPHSGSLPRQCADSKPTPQVFGKGFMLGFYGGSRDDRGETDSEIS